MVASGFGTLPEPMSIWPSSARSQYRRSPSGVEITCWILAPLPPRPLRNASLAFSRCLSSAAHSSDRNCTGTSASFRIRGPGSSAAGEYSGEVSALWRVAEELRIGEVQDVVEEQHARTTLVELDRADRRVLGDEEHLVPDPEKRSEICVDHAAVADHHDVAVRMAFEDRVDRASHAFLERV